MVDGNVEVPETVGLGGFDHHDLDFVRKSGEGDGEG